MKIGVSLLNWNNAEDTCACLASLLAAKRVPDLIVVWDNGSDDESVQIIRERFADVVVIASKKNIGFAAANNRVAEHLIKQGMDAVWVLNNDTEVDGDCLEIMSSALDSDMSLAAVTGKMFFLEPKGCIWYGGGHVNRMTLNAIHDHIGQTGIGFGAIEKYVDFVSGCSMLIRTTSLQSLGLFNESYFVYYEDLDWSLRITHAGGKLLYIPDATLVHRVSATMKKNAKGGGRCTPMQHYLQARNHLYVIRTHAENGVQCFVAVALTLLRRIMFVMMNVCLLRMDKVKSILKGVKEGLGSLPLPAAPLAPVVSNQETPST
jgi:GT2 family glycosyltransferase